MSQQPPSSLFPSFDRRTIASDADFTVIGTGEIGGKAKGLACIKRILADCCGPDAFPGVTIGIPRLAVLATDTFSWFMEHNRLWDIALSDQPDERIAHAFQQAEMSPLIVGDLRALIAATHTPLAVRSSSLLEDALSHPFAGTYATKMVPNNQATVAVRFQKLIEAIKLVYASTFFRDARSYMRAIGGDSRHEQMAVIIQEVVGDRFSDRFYPAIAGVVRTHNFYPTGPAKPADGVVNLALGLGRTIVDGGVVWTYSPAYPLHSRPFASAQDILKNTQTRFWAVNMGAAPAYDPIAEAEYLVQAGLADAEYDGLLHHLASTYDAASDRIVLGTGNPGPRVLTFAPLLELGDVPLNAIIRRLSDACRQALDADVEIEFAMTLDPRQGLPARFGFLQLRPMLVADDVIDVSEADLVDPRALVASERVLGNGALDTLTDVVYVKPDVFEARHTPAIAAELEQINRGLTDAGRCCILIGFGRWGSSDPWLGIPVTWPQISTARTMVEATRADMNVDPSQGSHFFHNLTSFHVHYLTVSHDGPYDVDWNYLDALPAVAEFPFVRHVRTPAPLQVRVDGRAGRGVIMRQDPEH